MRLGQLARKLEISPTQIINLLQSKEFSAVEGTNSKLSAEQISLVVKTFYKEPVTSEDVENEDNSSLTSEEESSRKEVDVVIEAAVQAEDVIETKSEIESAEAEEGAVAPSEEEEYLESEPEPELIKAPKISLPGLKVVGKIDLPEPKEVEEVESAVEEPQQEDAVEKKPPRVRGKRKPRPVQNLVAFERSREEKRKRRLRELKEKQAKEKRRKYYEKNFARTIEPQEKVEKQEDIVLEQVEEEKPKSKNWFVRIWRALDAK